MADRAAIDEIRDCLEWMRRHAAYMGGPGHVTDRDDAAALATRALGRLAELATCDRCAHPIDAPGEPRASRLCGPCVEADEGAAHRLELRLGTIRMYLENPKTVDPSVCAATCGVFRAVVRAVEAGEMRAEGRYIHGRGDERDDVRWAIDDQIATADPSDARWIAALNRLRETIDSEHHVDRAEQAKSATSAPPPDPHNHADELFRPTMCAACAEAAKGIG